MDVIINNPAPAAPYQAQVYTPMAPQGYGYRDGHDHHGPGFGFFLLLFLGGFLLLKGMKRRRWMAHQGIKGGLAAPEKEGFKKDRDFFERKGWWVKTDTALEIARERYARGEISLEELEAIKKGLE